MHKVINPSYLNKMSEEELKDLLDFFNSPSQAQSKAWQKGVTYTYGDNKTLEFKSNVIRCPRKEGKQPDDRFEFYYDEKNATLGKGGYANVYVVSGTLSSKKYKSLIDKLQSKGTSRAIKVQEANFDLLKKEAQLVKEVGHYSCKEPVETEINGKKVSFWVMEKINAKPLSSISGLDAKEKIKLTKNLLKALKNQVTDKGIIHRDLSTNNILVNLETMDAYY